MVNYVSWWFGFPFLFLFIYPSLILFIFWVWWRRVNWTPKKRFHYIKFVDFHLMPARLSILLFLSFEFPNKRSALASKRRFVVNHVMNWWKMKRYLQPSVSISTISFYCFPKWQDIWMNLLSEGRGIGARSKLLDSMSISWIWEKCWEPKALSSGEIILEQWINRMLKFAGQESFELETLYLQPSPRTVITAITKSNRILATYSSRNARTNEVYAQRIQICKRKLCFL